MHPTRILLALCICCCACKKKDDPKPAPAPGPNADIVGLWRLKTVTVRLYHPPSSAFGPQFPGANAVASWRFNEETCIRMSVANPGSRTEGPYIREGNVIIRNWDEKTYRDTLSRIASDTLVFRTFSRSSADPVDVKRYTYYAYVRQ